MGSWLQDGYLEEDLGSTEAWCKCQKSLLLLAGFDIESLFTSLSEIYQSQEINGFKIY